MKITGTLQQFLLELAHDVCSGLPSPPLRARGGASERVVPCARGFGVTPLGRSAWGTGAAAKTIPPSAGRAAPRGRAPDRARFASAEGTQAARGQTSVRGRKATADCVMILIAAITGRWFRSAVAGLAAAEGSRGSAVCGLRLPARALPGAVPGRGPGATSPGCSRLGAQPLPAFVRLAESERVAK